MNLFVSYKIDYADFQSYFLPNNMKTASITISTINGGLGYIVIYYKP